MTVAMMILAGSLISGIVGVWSWDQGSAAQRDAHSRTMMLDGVQRMPLWRRLPHELAMRTELGRNIDTRLKAAGRDRTAAGDVLLLAAIVFTAIVVFTQTFITFGASLVLATAVLVAANKYLDHMVQRRREKFAEQLPDIARIMSNAASAGMAIPNALALVTRELEEPARSILNVAVQQMEVGQSLAGAMEKVEEQVPSREMAILVSTLVIQQRSGGDVIEALREMSGNLESRRDLKREVETTMSGIKFTAYSVMGLGVVMLMVLETIAPGTLKVMTGTLIGQVLLGVASGLYLIGFILMRRMVKVEV